MLCPVCKKVELYAEAVTCLPCWYTGRYFEKVLCSDERLCLLEEIRGIPSVLSADVFHAGLGGFSLLVALNDGRIVSPRAVIEVSGVVMSEEGVGEEKGIAAVPMIPPVGGQWAIVVMRQIEGEMEYEETMMPESYSDAELIETMKEIAP